jgi:heat shock protein HslJ
VAEPPLVGTEWQLVSYQSPGVTGPISVKTDSTIEFNGKDGFSARACNAIGGGATIDGRTILFTPGVSTMVACTGERTTLDRQVEATAKGAVHWSIRKRILTLRNGDGYVLTYRVRPSIYPDPHARTIVAGDRAGGQFRLAVDRPAGGDGHLALVFEARRAPGEPWGTGGVISPEPKECLADFVLGVGSLGGQTFLAAWATPDVAKVTTRATSNSPETTLKLYDVPGSTLRIAGVWTATFRPSVSPVTFYDKHGKIIAAYPKGPC